MSAETHTSATSSESQQQFRRLLLKEYRPQAQAGDGLKRFGLNTGIFLASTGIDVVEGKVAEKILHKVFKGHKESQFHAWVEKNPGVEGAAEFIEEWGSDSLISAGTNKLVGALTGEKHAEYVSPFSEAAGEWTNTVLQVFKGDPKWRGITVKNLVSGVNVEAALRMISEVPLIGGAVSWTHEQLDTLMEQKAVKTLNTAAAKGILGYHIVTSKNRAVEAAVAAATPIKRVRRIS